MNSCPIPVSEPESCLIRVKIAVNTTSAVSIRMKYLPNSFDKGITLMEWGNTIKSALPKEYLEIKIDKDSNNENIRIFNFIPHGKHYEELIERI